jgi:hypothetical protein
MPLFCSSQPNRPYAVAKGSAADARYPSKGGGLAVMDEIAMLHS